MEIVLSLGCQTTGGEIVNSRPRWKIMALKSQVMLLSVRATVLV
jgi:hypothetical protein